MTKAQAETKRDERLAEVRAREAQAPNLEITFEQFLDGVALPFYRSKWKFSTASTTENRMTHHFAEFKKPLKDLTLKTLQAFLGRTLLRHLLRNPALEWEGGCGCALCREACPPRRDLKQSNTRHATLVEMQVPIKRAVERVPGGMMIVPLLLGSVIVTFAPATAGFFGSFTGALFTGSLPILAVFYVCLGATIPFEALPRIAKRGGALLATKIIVGILAGLVLGHLLGERPVSHGWFAGISTLAVVAAINDTNGGLYMALMEQCGRAEDAGAYALMSLESGPFLTMLTLGVAGLSAFPWQTLVGAILPLVMGLLLGNLDRELRIFLGRAAPTLIPFFGFALGATLDLHRVWQAGMLGLALGLCVVAVSGAALLIADRLTGGTGTAGLAAATTAGNAAAVPAIVASANPAYAEAAASATVLVAASVIVTALCAPPLTIWWAGRKSSAESHE